MYSDNREPVCVFLTKDVLTLDTVLTHSTSDDSNADRRAVARLGAQDERCLVEGEIERLRRARSPLSRTEWGCGPAADALTLLINLGVACYGARAAKELAAPCWRVTPSHALGCGGHAGRPAHHWLGSARLSLIGLGGELRDRGLHPGDGVLVISNNLNV